MTGKWKIILACVVAVALGITAWYFRGSIGQIDKERVIAIGKSVPAPALVISFLFLPLIGFPVSILFILLGLRFGFWWGAAISLVATYLQHLAAYHLCQGKLGDKLRSLVLRNGRELPDIKGGNAAWLTALFAALHGPPYTLKLYLLALARPPFLIFCFVGGTVYWLFGLVPIGAAAMASHVDVTWIYVLIMVASAAGLYWKWRAARKKQK